MTNATAQKVLENAIRSYQQGSSVSLKKAEEEFEFKALHSRDGSYLGHFPSFPLDTQRLDTIVETIVRGLYYHDRKQRFPDGYLFDIQRYYPQQFETIIRHFLRMNPGGPRIVGDVFAYMSAYDDENYWWILWFYGIVLFSVTALKPISERLD